MKRHQFVFVMKEYISEMCDTYETLPYLYFLFIIHMMSQSVLITGCFHPARVILLYLHIPKSVCQYSINHTVGYVRRNPNNLR